MMAKAAEHTEVWRARAEELASGGFESAERFDVITCLWNVLGHVPTAEKRLHALSAIASLLTPNGRFFLDVNHRYNARSYGVFPTAATMDSRCFLAGRKQRRCARQMEHWRRPDHHLRPRLHPPRNHAPHRRGRPGDGNSRCRRLRNRPHPQLCVSGKPALCLPPQLADRFFDRATDFLNFRLGQFVKKRQRDYAVGDELRLRQARTRLERRSLHRPAPSFQSCCPIGSWR